MLLGLFEELSNSKVYGENTSLKIAKSILKTAERRNSHHLIFDITQSQQKIAILVQQQTTENSKTDMYIWALINVQENSKGGNRLFSI